MCEKIWGGSSVSTTIPCVIETTDLSESSEDICPTTPEFSIKLNSSAEWNSQSQGQEKEELLPRSAVKERRNLLNSKLAVHKSEKLKRKPPNDTSC